MVEPEKKKGESKEQWKGIENTPAKSKRRVKKRSLTRPVTKRSFTSATSATSVNSLASGMKSLSIQSANEVSDELSQSRQSTSSLTGASPSLLTLTGPSPQLPEGKFPPKKPATPMRVVLTTDEPEVKNSRSSISIKTVKTPSRISLKSVMSAELKGPSGIKIERADSLIEIRLNASSHPRMSDIQIIEETPKVKEVKECLIMTESKDFASNQPMNNGKIDQPATKSGESGEESVVLWKADTGSDTNQSSDNAHQKRTTLESSVEKVDNIKNTIIQEYSNIIETIKQQNNNLEKIKREMLSITVPSIRKGLEKRYFAEEDKLNDELVKAMILQSRCPYERWPEIPVVPNIFDDTNSVHPHLLVNKARQHISHADQPPPERKSAGEEVQMKINYEVGEPTSSDESKSPCDPDNLFKDLLDKIDKINKQSIQTAKKSTDSLNGLIAHLLKRRKNHINHCVQCNESPKNCRLLEGFDEELCKVCKIKLGQLTKGNREGGGCESGDSKLSQVLTCGTSQGTSSSEDDQSTICSKQDISSLEDDQTSSILTQICKPEKEPRCCKTENKLSDPFAKKNLDDVNSIEASKLLCLFENMAADLKQISRKQTTISGGTDTDTEMAFEKQKLKERLREVNAEKEELKFIMREQESQMCDYRQRYLDAKQQIEEQLHQICELEKCNECIEERINEEMKRIQCKFKQNMKQLQMCLETQTKKLKQCCREKEKLSEKLNICCAELHKEKNKKTRSNGDQKSEQSKLKSDLQAAREMYRNSERNNAMQREEIRTLKCDLATLRKDTTSILCRSKERVQRQVGDLNKRIYELEDDLAKERAHSCCALKEKERCCRLLENALCESQTAKAQLKTLQAYVKTLCNQLESQKIKSC